MKTIRTFLLSTAVCAIIASPVLAMDLTADAMLGATPEDMTTVKMVEDSAFVGNEVRTNDQKVIGLVKGVSMNEDGSNLVFVELSGDIAAKSSVKNFTVNVPKDMTADGSLTLGWNEIELFKALSSNLTATESGG
jgi:sporulation protein YlmC with PRC-barrel domain